MPIVTRRLFATSRSSIPRSSSFTRRPKISKSSFLDRFGPPDEQPSHIQPPFPAWPGRLSSQPVSSRLTANTIARPPPNLLTPIDKTRGKDGPEEASSWTFGKRRKGELFSDTIGNVSELVRTYSFEAKLAIQPAMEARKQQMLAAKNNLHRFRSLPTPAEHKFDQEEKITAKDSLQNSDDSPVTKSPNSSANILPKANSHITRSLHIPPSGHRMLSTLSVESSFLCAPLATKPPLSALDEWVDIQSPKLPTSTSLWSECLTWVLASAASHRSRSSFSTNSIFRRLHSTPQHFMYSNRVLSLLHPAIYASPMVVRGYATRRSSGPQISTEARPPQSHVVSNTLTSPSSSSLDDTKAPFVLVPPPTNPTELCNALTHLIQSTNPRLLVSRLISTHSQYSSLHSAKSFNIVLAYAIRVAPSYVRPIVAQMQKSGIAWTPTTQKLAVRAHIQASEWFKAIELAERTWLPEGELGPSTAPLDVFIELMHFVLTPRSSQQDVAAMAKRCWRLFPTHANVDVTPRLAYNVVRLLVNQGHTDQAVQLTKRLLDSLTDVTPSTSRYCCAILGLVIRPSERSARRSGPYPTPPFHERLALFESLLAHNPSLGLTPDAKLTLCLLENLFRSRKKGSRAAHILGELRARYGPGVEDSAVRRLIARYANYDGNVQLAKAMCEREELARREPNEVLTALAETSRSSSKETPWAGDEDLPMQSHLEYIRNSGTENVKWTQLSRSIRRVEVDQGLVGAEKARGKRKHVTVWYGGLRRNRKLLKRARKLEKV